MNNSKSYRMIAKTLAQQIETQGNISLDKRNRHSLWTWYQKNHRPLPWRKTSDPYLIWLSETMLQQTTVEAVLPYYEKFLTLFPTIEFLARASQTEVLAAWAGLGYYSRARNLHQAAQTLVELGRFPKTHQELLKLRGFGPYTARAVSSIAFGEPVGVVDGNVIRVLSRFHAADLEWWKLQDRKKYQAWADKVVLDHQPGDMNQALMDLGSAICTPSQTFCRVCPLISGCKSFKSQTQLKFPRKKPQRSREIWYWQPKLWVANEKVQMVINQGQLPFLKNQWIFPGPAKKRNSKPERFMFRHSITHHDIFVLPQLQKGKARPSDGEWVSIQKLAEWNPSSLIKKTLNASDKDW